jgi:peptide/nickel transport system substrate-binding protein
MAAKRPIATALKALALGLPLAAAFGLPATAQTTLKLIPQADLKILDPIWSSANITLNHANMIYETLFALDSKFNAKPQMLEAYKVSDDSLTYTFTLRPGLKWEDGTPVTTADVIQSLKRWGARDDEGRIAMGLTAELAAVDARTFTWKLKEKFGVLIPVLAKLGAYPAFIMQEATAKTEPTVQIDTAIGSGPFKFIRNEWVPGSKAVYVKSASYVPRTEPTDMMSGARIAKVDRVEWVYLPDPATATAALNAGEVDFYEAPKPDLIPLMRANANVVVRVNDPLGVMVLMRPNQLHPPFNTAKGRQALLYMVDQSEYMTAFGGTTENWKTCDSLLYCGTSAHSNAGAIKLGGKPDLAKAKALIAESGYKGEKVVVLHPTDSSTTAASLITAENFKKIGLNVELQSMDWSTLTQRRGNKNAPDQGGWSVFHTSWEGASINPLSYSAIGGACDKAWFGWPCNADIERLRLAWSREPDATKQKAILDELHALLVQEVPIVTLGQRLTPMAWRKNIEGVIAAPVLLLWNISKS